MKLPQTRSVRSVRRGKMRRQRVPNSKKEADGINKFGADGSFLEMMAKMDPKVLEEEARKTKEAAALAAKEAAAAKASTITPSQMSSQQNISIRDVED
mmetsp:Transcript_22324/g.42083  ORF Transcript_22324/g.42083 Transcript_22324/m.42083 type:complete len:98 (+) Transcript_22324:470-763(+)